MPETNMIPQSVIPLLDQSTAAADVPDPSAFVNSEWLVPVRAALAHLLDSAGEHADSNAAKSFRGNGLEVLLLARDEVARCNVYLRRHVDGETAPVAARQRTVTMTVNGWASFEGFRNETDVANDEPWYVRDFDSESLYACHPGTIHRLALSSDGCQVVLSREELDSDGSGPLARSDYLTSLAQARALMRPPSQSPGAPALGARP